MYRMHIKRPYHKENVLVETTIRELYDTLLAVYGDLSAKCTKGVKESELNENDAYKMVFNNEPTYGELQVIENAMYENAEIEEEYIAIHSAVVTHNNKAFLFAGHTEAGKSTLTAYLCRNGFGYYSDDIAIIKKNDMTVYAYPRPIQLRDGGVKVLEEKGMNLSGCKTFSYGEIKRTNLILPCEERENVGIGGVFFIKRAEENSVAQIEKFKAFELILKSLYVYVPQTPELMKLLSEICKHPIYELKYKDMDFVAQWILKS